MELHSSIQPRADGTLIVEGFGEPIVFRVGADGILSADVKNETAVAALLAGGDFYPADPTDFEHAIVLSQAAVGRADEDEHGPHDELDDPANPDALPVESNTPPKA